MAHFLLLALTSSVMPGWFLSSHTSSRQIFVGGRIMLRLSVHSSDRFAILVFLYAFSTWAIQYSLQLIVRLLGQVLVAQVAAEWQIPLSLLFPC